MYYNDSENENIGGSCKENARYFEDENIALSGMLDNNCELNEGAEINVEGRDEDVIDMVDSEPYPLQKCQVEFYPIGWEDYERTVLIEQSIIDIDLANLFQDIQTGTKLLMDDSQIALLLSSRVTGHFI